MSKPVVGEALKRLASAGVVKTRRGINGGLSVQADNVPESIMALTAPLRHMDLVSVVEARRPVELRLALLASERAKPPDHTVASKEPERAEATSARCQQNL